MKALRTLIIILVVILAIVLIPPLFMPSELFIEQSLEMKAQPEIIWDQVNCLENWELWDVWHQDTNMTGRYEGPECGVGAKNIWTYNNSDDGGSQTIVESKKDEYIKTYLDFQRMGTAESEMFFEKTDKGTKVTWNLRSKASYPLMRWINALFVKPQVEKSYAQGLKNLDALTENMKLKPSYITGTISIEKVESLKALAIRVVAGMENMEDAMGTSFGQLMKYISENKYQMAGPPRAIYYKWDEEQFEFDNAIPVAGNAVGRGDIKLIKTYSGKTVHVTHQGDYESTQYSWEAVQNYIQANNLESNGDPYEVYITDPQNEPDSSKWITELYWPVK